jgi:hypothetical protein
MNTDRLHNNSDDKQKDKLLRTMLELLQTKGLEPDLAQ